MQHERPGQGDTLLLTAGKFGRPGAKSGVHLHHLEHFRDALHALPVWDALGFEAELQVPPTVKWPYLEIETVVLIAPSQRLGVDGCLDALG